MVITEIDPICALQAAMDGYQVLTLDDVVETADIFVTATGNKDVITAEHMARMKHQAIVGNIGHFDNEIDMAGLSRVPGITKIDIKPQVDEWVFPDGHSIIVLSEGRLLNLGNATGHPSFVMSNSFTNQVIAQIELFAHPDRYELQVYTLPKHLDEKVARLHLPALGAKLTTLTAGQAAYLGIPTDGPLQVRPLPVLSAAGEAPMAKTRLPAHEIADLGLDRGRRVADRLGGRADAGAGRIRDRFRAERPLDGVRLGACLHVTAETANLVLALADGGAHVALCSANPLSAQDDVAAALVYEHGIEVRAVRGEDLDTYVRHVRAVLDGRPQVTVDDGADLLMTAHARGGEALAGADRRYRGDDHRARPAAPARGRGQSDLRRPGGQRGPHRTRPERSPRHRAIRPRRDRPGQSRAAGRPHAGRGRLWLGGAGHR